MARTFTKNTANYMTIGSGNGKGSELLNGAASIAAVAWVKLASLTTAGVNNNRVLDLVMDGTTVGVRLNIPANTNANGLARHNARDTAAGTNGVVAGATTFGLSAWALIAGVSRISADTQSVYRNAVEDGTNTPAWAAASYTHGTPTAEDRIMGPSALAANDQIDGDGAEVALFKKNLTTADLTLMATNKYSPAFFGPTAYWILLGQNSPEPDMVGGVNGVITGTVAAAAHPYVKYPWSGACVGC